MLADTMVQMMHFTMRPIYRDNDAHDDFPFLLKSFSLNMKKNNTNEMSNEKRKDAEAGG